MAKSFHQTSAHSSAHRAKYRTVADMVLRNNPASILDLGCGSGLLESELLSRGYRGIIHGYDGSENMLAIAKDFVKSENVKFSQSMIDGGFDPGQLFDAIVSINLLFYLDDKPAFMNMAAQHLNGKDSVFALITPKPGDQTSNWEFVKAHFGASEGQSRLKTVFGELKNLPGYIELAIRQNKLNKLEKNGEIIFDTPEEIAKMAQAAGLTVLKTEDVHAGQNWLFEMKLVGNNN